MVRGRLMSSMFILGASVFLGGVVHGESSRARTHLKKADAFLERIDWRTARLPLEGALPYSGANGQPVPGHVTVRKGSGDDHRSEYVVGSSGGAVMTSVLTYSGRDGEARSLKFTKRGYSSRAQATVTKSASHETLQSVEDLSGNGSHFVAYRMTGTPFPLLPDAVDKLVETVPQLGLLPKAFLSGLSSGSAFLVRNATRGFRFGKKENEVAYSIRVDNEKRPITPEMYSAVKSALDTKPAP